MQTININHSKYGHEKETAFGTRMCMSDGEPAVEMHVEHYCKKFDAKNGRTHFNFFCMSIEEAEQLRDYLIEAIKDAKERKASLPNWEVASSNDNGVVFAASTVAEEAKRRSVSLQTAARDLAQENDDPETDERLFARQVQQ